MFKFLHTADIHLDSPLLNLDNYDDAPREEFRSATRRAFDNIVDLAIAEDVRFVLIAGDLYDGDCSDFNTPLHFRRRMEDLQAKNIRVFIVQGNHDAANNMKKAFRLHLPDNVHIFATDAPETVTLDDLKVAIHGQGFAQKAVEDDLSKDYPDPVAGHINIGMLHTNCGAREGRDNYAPSTVEGLTAKRYHYWALGHIHKSWDIGPSPWIVYPGNPQGRAINETGPRACVIATCEGDRIVRKRHNVDVMRWERVNVPIDACEDVDTVLTEVEQAIDRLVSQSDDLPLAIRIELTGTSPVHRKLIGQADHWDRQIRETVLDHFDERVWVEKILFQTKVKVDRSVELDSALGELIEDLAAPDLAEFALSELQSDFERLLTSVPTDPRLEDVSIRSDDETTMATLLTEARELLIARILDSGSDA